MLPGAAARAPIKRDCDVRPRNAATKVRTPFRQTSNATLEAALAVLANNLWCHTRQRTNKSPAHDRARFHFPARLVTTSGTTSGADIQ